MLISIKGIKVKMFFGPVRVKSRIRGMVRSKPATRLLVKTKPENRPTNMNIRSGPTDHMLIPRLTSPFLISTA